MHEAQDGWVGAWQEEGIFIVCSGLVLVRYDVLHCTSQAYHIGFGNMFGVFSALTGGAPSCKPHPV